LDKPAKVGSSSHRLTLMMAVSGDLPSVRAVRRRRSQRHAAHRLLGLGVAAAAVGGCSFSSVPRSRELHQGVAGRVSLVGLGQQISLAGRIRSCEPKTPARASKASAGAPSARVTYLTGIAWCLSHFAICVCNDGIMKFLGGSISAAQIVFMRFTMAGLVLLPLLLIQGAQGFKTTRLWMHGVRGLLLALGTGLWCFGLRMLPLASAVVVNNTMPFFKMLFAKVILDEKVGKERWLTSIGGFVGCLIVFNPTATTFKPQSLILILSAMCFAMLDIINKKYSVAEPLTCTLFYGSVATALLSAPLALKTWTPLASPQLALFGLLGIGANLLLYCLILSFRYVDASATCPYHYTEFVLSAIVGLLVFGEKPLASTLLGSCIILPSVVYGALCETRAGRSSDSEAAAEVEPAVASVFSAACAAAAVRAAPAIRKCVGCCQLCMGKLSWSFNACTSNGRRPHH